MVQGKSTCVSYKIHKKVKKDRENWDIVENTHDAIIDRNTWNKVHELREKSYIKVNVEEKEKSVFTGKLKCADCGRAMCKNPSGYYKGKPRPYYYYVCSTYKQRSIDLCTSHNIRNTILEESVLQAIKM